MLLLGAGGVLNILLRDDLVLLVFDNIWVERDDLRCVEFLLIIEFDVIVTDKRHLMTPRLTLLAFYCRLAYP